MPRTGEDEAEAEVDRDFRSTLCPVISTTAFSLVFVMVTPPELDGGGDSSGSFLSGPPKEEAAEEAFESDEALRSWRRPLDGCCWERKGRGAAEATAPVSVPLLPSCDALE